MSILRSVSAFLAAPALASAAVAQVPVVPVAPVPAVAPPVVSPFPAVTAPLTPATPLLAPLPPAPDPIGIAPFPPPPGPTTTLASFLGLSNAQIEYRQRAFARTPLGQVRSRIQNRLSDLTGGLIPKFPPQTPTLAELQAPGPVGAAAKVKLDRMGAKDRIDALQYLATVDCHYWPEAADALVGALRTDRNEWVRLEAAKTLQKGCCCNKKTIAALTFAASCSDADGNPAEKSPRVVAAAQQALTKCLNAVCSTPVVAPVPTTGGGEGEQPKGEGASQASWSKPAPAGMEKGPGGLPADMVARPTGKAYYDMVERTPWPQVIAAAKYVLEHPVPLPAELVLAGGIGMDAEEGGVATAAARARTDRPANLLDMLTGDDAPPAPPTPPVMAYSPSRTPAVPPASVPAPQPPAPPAPRFTLSQPPAAPAAVRAPAPQPTFAVQAQATVPAKIPAPTPPASEPSRVPPTVATAVALAKPTPPAPPVEPVVLTPPAKPAAKPVLLTPPAEPVKLPAAPAPTPAQPTGPAMPPKAARVVTMLAQPTDPRQMEKEIDGMSADDVKAHPAVVPALMRAAEEQTDVPVRAACVRALVRGKANTPGVMLGLQRLVNDRAVDVRIEAAAGLAELRGEKK